MYVPVAHIHISNSQEKILYDTLLWFPAEMNRDNLFRILTFIHLPDSSKQEKKGYDTLYKVRPLIDHLTVMFPKYYQHARDLSLDDDSYKKREFHFWNTFPKSQLNLADKISKAKTGYVLNFKLTPMQCLDWAQVWNMELPTE